ncbi:O-succinylbenzoate synthase [Pullulanibacillus pueri]|uniref:o-succinylbenzoate synthase n=1 Tax=Pullulanibacillus pueri TaxID=1437324 RepID=A0A8J3EKP7_9BACL|nr:o-succinylbenzoate synthase [Pullulanibacillus pueri]MBM7679963.1 O-succinylbenzoate synthase [Pullulanibacillus pueri]GGH73695.1 o-succinylbenzoate synthase [Pullulanibacillus pueri]
MKDESIQLNKVIIRKLEMKMKHPFKTSYGSTQTKQFLLIEAIDQDGRSGWGESVAMDLPWYTEETVKTTEYLLEDVLIPLLLKSPIDHPDQVSERFAFIRRNNMAKASVEGAIWDLYAKRQDVSLARALGGKKSTIDVGISLGLPESMPQLFEQIESYLREGYKRFKFKIKPGQDVAFLRAIREVFPDLPMMADANSAYTLKDSEHLKQLDDLDLMMIEQPLGHEDILDHAELQKQLQTPICLDESIHSLDDVRHAIRLGSCQIINIKIGRVGGLTMAKRIHDLCAKHGIEVWCGGMLEAGVGRAHNIALTTLSQFTLPGDTAGSSRYWFEDIIQPEVTVKKGTIEVPTAPGIGYAINHDAVKRYLIDEKVYTM